MIERHLEVTLALRAPFLTQTSAASRPGLDAAVARRNGQIVLPGTLIRGKLREAWTDLVQLAGDVAPLTADEIACWLGQKSPEHNEPQRGRLGFVDFVPQTVEEPGARYRVAMDPHRGATQRGHLAAVEVPFAPGRIVSFRGVVRFVADAEEAARVHRAVEAGLRFVESIGAYRSLGFGRVVEVQVETRPVARRTARSRRRPRDEAPEKLDLEIEVSEPILLARFQPQGNLFVGERAIAGAALKGALAATWRESLGLRPSGPVTDSMDEGHPALARHFSALRFRHAFLGAGGRRPLAVPFSLVHTKAQGRDEIYDVALLSEPCLFRGRAPAFAPDWKGAARQQAERWCGWVTPRYETRVRTRIDSPRRKGADGELFAYRALVPRDGQAFYGRIGLEGVPVEERAEVADALGSLLADGLRHLGKTGCWAPVQVRPAGSVVPACPRRRGVADADPLVLLLQTPALLLEPQKLDESWGRSELAAEYGRLFAELSNGELTLLRYFAHQRLAGGGYLYARYQHPSSYHPYVLNDAGSVFVFERTLEAEACLESWSQGSLPLPAWVAATYGGPDGDGVERPGDDWRRCPFLPANGYGEVVVDAALHWDLAPGSAAEPILYLEAEESS